MNSPVPELNQRLSKLYSSAVHDVLRDQGFTNFVLPASIKPLHRSFKLFGPIFTIEGQLTNEHSSHETLIEWTKLLSSIPANHVGVCQPHNRDIALMGELSAETLKKRNVSGYLVDGGAETSQKLSRFDSLCFARLIRQKMLWVGGSPKNLANQSPSATATLLLAITYSLTPMVR